MSARKSLRIKRSRPHVARHTVLIGVAREHIIKNGGHLAGAPPICIMVVIIGVVVSFSNPARALYIFVSLSYVLQGMNEMALCFMDFFGWIGATGAVLTFFKRAGVIFHDPLHMNRAQHTLICWKLLVP